MKAIFTMQRYGVFYTLPNVLRFFCGKNAKREKMGRRSVLPHRTGGAKVTYLLFLLFFPVAGTFLLGEIRRSDSVNPLWGFVSMAFMFSIDMNALRAIE
jgi:hypothetical protein